MNKKDELVAYFKAEINEVSKREIVNIQQEIEDIRVRTVSEMETEAKREADSLLDSELRELMSEHKIACSKIAENQNQKLMKEREALVEQVFAKAKDKLEAFSKTTAYETSLVNKLSAISQKGFVPAIVYVREADKAILPTLLKAYGSDCEGCVDPLLMLGGFRLECSEKGIIVDESFDSALEDAKTWFYDHSGLTIR